VGVVDLTIQVQVVHLVQAARVEVEMGLLVVWLDVTQPTMAAVAVAVLVAVDMAAATDTKAS